MSRLQVHSLDGCPLNGDTIQQVDNEITGKSSVPEDMNQQQPAIQNFVIHDSDESSTEMSSELHACSSFAKHAGGAQSIAEYWSSCSGDEIRQAYHSEAFESPWNHTDTKYALQGRTHSHHRSERASVSSCERDSTTSARVLPAVSRNRENHDLADTILLQQKQQWRCKVMGAIEGASGSTVVRPQEAAFKQTTALSCTSGLGAATAPAQQKMLQPGCNLLKPCIHCTGIVMLCWWMLGGVDNVSVLRKLLFLPHVTTFLAPFSASFLLIAHDICECPVVVRTPFKRHAVEQMT